MAEDTSLIECYVDLCKTNNKGHIITEGADWDNFFKFTIPVTVEFAIKESDISKIYPISAYQEDIANNVSFVALRAKLIKLIDEHAEEKFQQVLKVEGFEVKPNAELKLANAKRHGTTIAKILKNYEKELNNYK